LKNDKFKNAPKVYCLISVCKFILQKCVVRLWISVYSILDFQTAVFGVLVKQLC